MTTDLWCVVVIAFWTLPMVMLPPFGKMRAAGVSWGAGNRDVEPEVPAWVKRAERAAENHKENLPLFVATALVAHVSGEHDDVTAVASVVYVAARVVHGLVYQAGISILAVRTVAYYAALGSVVVILSRLF